ncbi:remorin-like [Rhododendron vialii]|uniref:remorin-like n=1 Tax=Rhododendron vialii TaxID=182163 RepID=UPI00266056F2|nr:remorin-like [Rhododendron vialii]
MAEVQEPKKVESETPSEPPPPPAPAPAPEPTEAPTDVAEEKSVIPPPPPPPEEKPDDSKSLAVVGHIPDSVDEKPVEEKPAEGSINRDAVLARVATEKRISLIRAWEESEKSKAENKAQKKLSEIGAWENTKKANVDAELKRMVEKLEKQKATYVETMKNKVAIIHKEAEEKRAIIEARRGEDLLKAEEIAAKYRATGTAPKKLLGCF